MMTERLLHRKPQLEDAHVIYGTYGLDPEVTRYPTWRPNQTSEETIASGMIEARVDKWQVNLGYVLAREHWGHGYMSEAVNVVTVWAVCDFENIASARVLEKVGMQREGILRRWMILPNRSELPRDCYCYSKVK